MDKIDESLKALLEQGREKGYLTFTQVNDYLPNDAINPEKLDQLILMLEEQGIELIDDDDVAERENGTPVTLSDDDVRGELDLSFIDEDDSRRIDDPVRMYLTQMGEIPLLNARGRNRPGQEDRGHAQAFSPQGPRMRRRPAPGRRNPETRPLRRTALRSHGQGVADRKPREGQDPPAHAAQSQDAGAPDGAERAGLREGPRSADARGRETQAAPQRADPAPQNGHPGRGAVHPDPEGPAADEEAGAVLGPHGRAGTAD